MKFSLILGTVGRTNEVARFLQCLDAQSYRNFELIIVDQNEDDRLAPVLANYAGKFDIRHLRSLRGLSRARNVGLKVASGDVIAFPDDDCWYSDDLLDKVATTFDAYPELDGMTGRFTDADGRSEGRWLGRSMRLTKYNVWRGAISFSIFLRKQVVAATGGFNESLGVGAGTEWGAAEETDYLLRAMSQGFNIHYFHELILHHPLKSCQFDDSARARQKKYEQGIGRVMRINRYPLWYFPLTCLRTCCGICFALVSGRYLQARFKCVSVAARFYGWRTRPN